LEISNSFSDKLGRTEF
jgi:hypothetical protein